MQTYVAYGSRRSNQLNHRKKYKRLKIFHFKQHQIELIKTLKLARSNKTIKKYPSTEEKDTLAVNLTNSNICYSPPLSTNVHLQGQ